MMRPTLILAAVALAICAAPANAADGRWVAPDGRSMAYSSFTPYLAADGDTLYDVYSWNRGSFSLASPGPGSDPYGASANFISDDGTRVVFTTRNALVAADTDTATDVYETAGGTTSLVSTGPADASAPEDIEFGAASEDGTRLFFVTNEPMVAADTDSNRDIYMRSGGATTLVSATPAGVADGHHSLVAVSRNGERVVELTGERLSSDDTDSADDLYERFGGAATLISKGPVEDSTPDFMLWMDVTPDAKSIVVLTQQRFTSGDKNEDFDLYQFSRGRTTLVSSGSDGVSPDCPGAVQRALGLETPTRRPPCEPVVAGQTDTGSKVLFYSPKPFNTPPGLLGWSSDDLISGLFEKSADGSTRLLDDQAGISSNKIAADGSRYIIETRARRAAADTDDMEDLYLVEGGSSTLLTPAGSSDALYRAVAFSDDARRVFFRTSDRLVPEDTNDDENTYVSTDTGPKLALTGPDDSDPAGLGAFIGASATGDRWYFFTTRSLIATDTDGDYDFYLRHLDGTTRQLSP